jgi:hypothetical protein
MFRSTLNWNSFANVKSFSDNLFYAQYDSFGQVRVSVAFVSREVPGILGYGSDKPRHVELRNVKLYVNTLHCKFVRRNSHRSVPSPRGAPKNCTRVSVFRPTKLLVGVKIQRAR